MKSSRNIIFVGGIHGVGKSTICRRLCADLNLEYLSASELITDYKAMMATKNLDKGKLVINISDNQAVLAAALRARKQSEVKRLLDGHFTLLDVNKQVKGIPLETFIAIMPKVLIVLVDDPGLIMERLLKRDGRKYDLALLAYMQEQELLHAKQIGFQMSLDAHEVSINEAEHMKHIISDVIA